MIKFPPFTTIISFPALLILGLTPGFAAEKEAAADAVNGELPLPAQEVKPLEAANVPTVKLLTIGNSLADDTTAYIEAMAKAAGKKVVVFRANLGGHSMEQHVKYLTAFEKDPNDAFGHAYKKRKDPKTGELKDFSLAEALDAEAWDYVTIQQVTQLSFKFESFEPYAGTLVSYTHKHAPTAKVLVLQTWAYRPDNTSLKTWKIDSETMYQGLKSAYDQLAAAYSLGIIPCGDAFHTASALPQWNTIVPDPNFDFANPAVDALPVESQSLQRGWFWRVDKKTGKKTFQLDAKHGTKDGRYLANCVLYNSIFHEDPPASSVYCPDGVKPADADILREVAIKTVKATGPTPAAVTPAAQVKSDAVPAK